MTNSLESRMHVGLLIHLFMMRRSFLKSCAVDLKGPISQDRLADEKKLSCERRW